MTQFSSIELEADQYEDDREFAEAYYADLDANEAMWAKIEASNRHEITLTEAEVVEIGTFLLNIF